MVISTQNLIELFHYSEKEKFQLNKCIRIHSQKGMGSTAKCCGLFWDKVFSCCNQSSWDRALKTMRVRVSRHPDCPFGCEEKISKFLMRYIISKEAVRGENVPLLPTQMKNPVDELVARAGEIDFFDLFHRVPYSENALSYPDKGRLFNLFKNEFTYLEEATKEFSNAMSTNPVIQAAKRVEASINALIRYTEKPKSAETVIDQFEEGINQTKAILEKARPLLHERNFESLGIERGYLHFKTLRFIRPQILRLRELMAIVTTTRVRW